MGDDNQQPDVIAPVPEQVVQEVVSKQVHQLMLGLQVSQSPTAGLAIVDKFQPEHISATLASVENENKREHFSNRLYFIGSIVGALLLCILFLGFNQAPLVEKVLVAFLGFAGGYGLGKGTSKK